MKTLPCPLTVVTVLVFAWSCAAQTPAPSREGVPAYSGIPVIADGLVVYRGQAFLVRNGRAAMINRTLVPEGQLLTLEGRLVPLPAGFSPYSHVAPESAGILVYGGRPFWLSRGRTVLIDRGVVPEGQVLTAEGRLTPLPADFGGFEPVVLQPLSTELGVQPAPGRAGGEVVKASPAEPVQWVRPVGGVSPVSGVHTFPGYTAAHLTNGATRTSVHGGTAAGSTLARPVEGGKQDHGTKAVTVGAPTLR